MNKKVAIPIWQNRVSPVMDTAGQLAVFTADSDNNDRPVAVNIPNVHPFGKIDFIKNLGIEVLICGAISRQMVRNLGALNIKIIPFIRGAVDEVYKAYRNGELQNGNYFLPGYCMGKQGRRRARCRRNRGYKSGN